MWVVNCEKIAKQFAWLCNPPSCEQASVCQRILGNKSKWFEQKQIYLTLSRYFKRFFLPGWQMGRERQQSVMVSTCFSPGCWGFTMFRMWVFWNFCLLENALSALRWKLRSDYAVRKKKALWDFDVMVHKPKRWIIFSHDEQVNNRANLVYITNFRIPR